MHQAIEVLNFKTIIDQVKQLFIFDLSHDYVDGLLKVENNFNKVSELQQFTEMLYLDQAKFGLPELLPIPSFKYTLKKLEREQVLEVTECLIIAHLYQNIQSIYKFHEKHEEMLTDKKRNIQILESMHSNIPILKSIYKIIDEKGNIQDNASPFLFSLRQDKKTTEQSIRTTLQQLMQSQRTKLSEQLYTIRNNRYVLPIKAEYKNSFAGILHDQSASGTTAYIEPQSLVNINNRLQQLEVEERQEIERLLLELSHALFLLKEEIKQNAWSIARYDIYNAKATHAYQYQLSKVEILQQQEIELYDAKHPLLNNEQTIGNDVLLGKTYQILMITGANTGGKSVFLKTIGILALMAQTGLFLPVNRDKNNRIGVFQKIFIDIGDEQSLEQNLSTFSGHIQNMKSILENSDKYSLVLLDELGSGTDPVQGSALAIAMLEELQKKEALIVGTTHFNEVKEFIVKAPYAENAAMIFDVEKLAPTYKIRYGSYGASYAFDIAQALQMPFNIIDNAKKQAESFSNNAQELLSIYEQRLKSLDDLEQELATKEIELGKQTIKLTQKIHDAEREIERERKKVLATAEKDLTDKIQKVNTLLEDLKDKKTLKQNEHADIKGMINKLNTGAVNNIQSPKMQQKQQPLHENDTVYVQKLQSNGTLLKKQGNKWLVKVGNLSMTLAENELAFVKKGKQKKSDIKNIRKNIRSVPAKLDLRGLRVLEGIEALETYLANASSTHSVVQIIHGHGTGSMREAVQEVLRRNKSVKSFRFGGEGEGGVGATIVEFN